MNGLLTDLYELTMAAGYFEAGKTAETAVFELAVRRLPPNRNLRAGRRLPQVVDYLLNLGFTAEEIAYLRGLPQFRNVSPASSITCATSASRATSSPCPKARRCSPASPC
jgi:nicotinate phosphoribosyltransferase